MKQQRRRRRRRRLLLLLKYYTMLFQNKRPPNAKRVRFHTLNRGHSRASKAFGNLIGISENNPITEARASGRDVLSGKHRKEEAAAEGSGGGVPKRRRSVTDAFNMRRRGSGLMTVGGFGGQRKVRISAFSPSLSESLSCSLLLSLSLSF